MLYVTCYKYMLLHVKLNILPILENDPKNILIMVITLLFHSGLRNDPFPPRLFLGNDYHPPGTVATHPMEQEQGMGL